MSQISNPPLSATDFRINLDIEITKEVRQIMAAKGVGADIAPTLTVVTSPPDADEIDRNLYLDFLSRKVMKGWVNREVPPSDVPWTALRKPLQCDFSSYF